MPAPRIFLSSTWLDLRAERHAVEQALQRMNATRFAGMEYFGARDETTRQVSLSEVDRSDVYIGVIGHRYGSGITEAEYHRAVARGLPCLIYLKRNDGPAPSIDSESAPLQALRAMLRSRHLVAEFDHADELATAIAVDLHNLLFDRLIVDGLQALRSDYDTRIQRFFAEYLGSPAAPIAFGGRKDEIEHLDAWFNDDHAPPCALLAGPAGRGKSALLVHWSRRLARRDDVDVVFIPISVRFRTNTAAVVFSSLAARLAVLHGDVIPGALETPAEAWRAVTTALLRRPPQAGRRIVVVLDGADEAADWKAEGDLLPPRLPPGLRVVVAARLLGGDTDGRGWIERLDWADRGTVIDLQTLTPLGMIDVLRRMSVPLDRLSGRTDIVAALYRLTHGDPLLVNLYVADLWTRGEGVARLRVEDLSSIEPGMEGYFKRWWSDQRVLWGAQSPMREASVVAVLDTLACALGPLKTRELAELVGGTGAPLSVWSLEEAIRVLERFVIGDGEAQGYAFTHPRLADHFRDRLAKAGQALDREIHFVEWGLRCLDAGGNAAANPAFPGPTALPAANARADVPDYLLQYLRAHMRRCGRPDEDFVSLVSARWIAAWERLDRGTYSGFAADLDHVRAVAARRAQAAAREGQASAFAAVQWRGALVAGSIVGLHGEMPLAVVGALLERGVWSPTQAVAYASRLGDEAQRLRALLACTGWFDPAYQALAVSAAASALTTLGIRAQRTLREVMRELAIGAGASGIAAAAVSRTVIGVAQVARQLSGEQGRDVESELVALLEWNGSDDGDLALEQRIDAAQALESHLPDQAERLRRLVDTLRAQLAGVPINDWGVRGRSGEDPGPVWLLDRFRLLCDAVHDEQPDSPPDMAYAALRAAFGMLLLRSAAVPSERAEANALAARVLCRFSEATFVDGLTLLLDVNGPLPLQPLMKHAAALPTPIGRAKALAQLHRFEQVPLPPELSGNLLVDAAALTVDDAADVFHVIVDVLDVVDQAAWLSLLGMRPHPSKWLALLDSAGLGQEERGALGDRTACLRLYAQQTLAVLADFAAKEIPRSRRTAEQHRIAACLSVLCDRIEPPGLGDALETWRVEARREQMDDTERLERILDRADLDVASLQAVARQLAATIADAVPQVLQRPAFASWPEQVPVDEQALALHARYQAWIDNRGANATAEDGRHPLHACLVDQAEDASADERLRRLAACATLIDAETLGTAAASLLSELSIWELSSPEGVLALLAILQVPPFMPPVLALQRALGQLAHEVTSAGHSSAEPYVRSLASAPMPDALRIPMLDALLAGPTGSKLNDVLRHSVEALARRSVWQNSISDHDANTRALREALFEASSRGRRTSEVSGATATGDDTPIERPTDDAARLEMLSSDARWGSRPTRACMLESLTLATRLGKHDMAVELAHRVLLRRDEHPTLLAAVVDAALALRDDRRAALFAEVAPRLPSDALAAAVHRLRRLDDGFAAVRAMLAMLDGIEDIDTRVRALQVIAATIERLPAGPERAAAGVLLAPELAVDCQHQLLQRAVTEQADLCLIVDDEVLYRRWAQALADAPTRTLHATINALRRSPDRVRRAGFGVRLLTLVPEWMRPQVLDLVADDDDSAAAVAPWLDAATLDRIAERRPLWRGLPRGWTGRLERHAKSASAGGAFDAGGMACVAAYGLSCLSTPRNDRQRHAVACSLALSAGDLDATRRCELLSLALSIEDDALRAEAGAYCAVLAPPDMHAQALHAVLAIPSKADLSVALALIAQATQDPSRGHTIRQALQAAASEANVDLAAQATVECLRLLAGDAWDDALEAALPLLRSNVDHTAVLQSVGDLLELLTDEQAASLLAALLETDLANNVERLCEHEATRWMHTVATKLGPLAARAALSVLTKTAARTPAAARGRALTALAPRLPDVACAEACNLLMTIHVDHAWLDSMLAVARRWPAAFDAGHSQQLVAVLNAIGDDDIIADSLVAMATAWPSSDEPSFVKAVAAIMSPAHRCDAIAARCHAAGASASLVGAVQAIPDPLWRSVARLHLTSCCKPLDHAALTEALHAVSVVGGRALMLDALCDVACRRGDCPAPLFDRLVSTSRGKDLQRRIPSIASTLDSGQAWQATELIIEEGGDPTSRDQALVHLAPRLDAQQRRSWPQYLAARLTERSCANCMTAAVALADDPEYASAVVEVACTMRSRVFGAELALLLLDRIDPAARAKALARFVDDAPNDRERRRVLRMARDSLVPPYPAELTRWLAWLDESGESSVSSGPSGPGADMRGHSGRDSDPVGSSRPVIATLLNEAMARAIALGDQARRVEAPKHRSAAIAPGAAPLLRRLHALPTQRDRYDELLRRFTALTPTVQAALFDHLPDLFEERLQAQFHRAVAGRTAREAVASGLQAAARMDQPNALLLAMAAWEPFLAIAGAETVQRVWGEFIDRASLEPRGVSLERVMGFAPVLAHRSGDAGLETGIEAIAELVQMWP